MLFFIFHLWRENTKNFFKAETNDFNQQMLWEPPFAGQNIQHVAVCVVDFFFENCKRNAISLEQVFSILWIGDWKHD